MHLSGKLLVAQPTNDDPKSESAVLFVYEQTRNFASAVCVNKMSDRSLAELADCEGYDYDGDEMLYHGGPDNPTALLLIHSGDWSCNNTYQITDDIFISSDSTMLSRLFSGDRPKKWKLCLGMHSWTKGKLEEEIMAKDETAWLYGEANQIIVFSEEEHKQYHWAIKSCSKFMTEQYFKI